MLRNYITRKPWQNQLIIVGTDRLWIASYSNLNPSVRILWFWLYFPMERYPKINWFRLKNSILYRN